MSKINNNSEAYQYFGDEWEKAWEDALDSVYDNEFNDETDTTDDYLVTYESLQNGKVLRGQELLTKADMFDIDRPDTPVKFISCTRMSGKYNLVLVGTDGNFLAIIQKYLYHLPFHRQIARFGEPEVS